MVTVMVTDSLFLSNSKMHLKMNMTYDITIVCKYFIDIAIIVIVKSFGHDNWKSDVMTALLGT